jgi:hypothetical protein
VVPGPKERTQMKGFREKLTEGNIWSQESGREEKRKLYDEELIICAYQNIL